MTQLLVVLGYSTWIVICVCVIYQVFSRTMEYWSKWDTFQRLVLVLVAASMPIWVGLGCVTYRLETYEHARFMDLDYGDCAFKAAMWPLYVPLRLVTDSHPWEQK